MAVQCAQGGTVDSTSPFIAGRPYARDADGMETIGERMKAARERLGLSQEEVARRAGLTLQSVYRYESGKVEPKISNVTSIATALECDPAWLTFGEHGEDRSEPDNLALQAFLVSRLGQTATDAELASLRDLTAYNGRVTPDTYAHMLTVLRTTVEPDPEAEARFQASGYMRSSLDRFKKK